MLARGTSNPSMLTHNILTEELKTYLTKHDGHIYHWYLKNFAEHLGIYFSKTSCGDWQAAL